MANELTINHANLMNRRPSYSRESDDIVRRCMSACEGRPGEPVALRNMPTTSDRDKLTGRRVQLVKAFDDFDRKLVGGLIADMLSYYNDNRDEDTKKTIGKWVLQLEQAKVPLWAVAMACSAIKNGNAPEISHIHRPTVIQFIVLARTYGEPFRIEARQISAVLNAKEYQLPNTPEQDRKIGTMLKELADELRTDCDAERAALSREVAVRIGKSTDAHIARQWRRLGVIEPQSVSPELAKQLGALT